LRSAVAHRARLIPARTFITPEPDEGDPTVAAEEPVTAPDQHKPSNFRLARIGASATIVILLMMLCGTHTKTERFYLAGTAGLLAAVLVADWLLRKNGLRPPEA
jgi:hypothetical protein